MAGKVGSRRGSATVGAVTLILIFAITIASISAVFIEFNRFAQSAQEAQEIAGTKGKENLEVKVDLSKTPIEVTVTNKGPVSSLITGVLVTDQSGNPAYYPLPDPIAVGPYDEKTFTITANAAENSGVGVLTSLGNAFWTGLQQSSTLPLPGWSYRKAHIIGKVAGAGTGYQIRVVAHYGMGTDHGEHVFLGRGCRPDFGDVRFTGSDGVTLLPYWIESKVDASYAVFWVKVLEDLSASDRTIYIYYGNPTASTTSNGEATFLFFDDFSTDLSKWTVRHYDGTGSASVVGGWARVDSGKSGDFSGTSDGGSGIFCAAPSGDYRVVIKFRQYSYPSSSGYNRFFMSRASDSAANSAFVGVEFDGDSTHMTLVWRDSAGGSAAWSGENTGWARGTYTTFYVQLTKTGTTFSFSASLDGFTWYPIGSRSGSYHGYIGLVDSSHDGYAEFDFCYVRKYASSEPARLWPQPEASLPEDLDFGSWDSTGTGAYKIFSNYAPGTVTAVAWSTASGGSVSIYNYHYVKGLVATLSGTWDTAPTNLQLATDGDLGTCTGTGKVTAPNVGYITWDLGEVLSKGLIFMRYYMYTSYYSWVQYCKLYISTDGYTWTKIYDSGQKWEVFYYNVTIPASNFRYVRAEVYFTLSGSGYSTYIRIYEFAVLTNFAETALPQSTVKACSLSSVEVWPPAFYVIYVSAPNAPVWIRTSFKPREQPASWLAGFPYRKSHVIGQAAGAGTGYQVRIVVRYGVGTDSGGNVYLNRGCRPDFGDVRFTGSDGVTPLPYWIESKVDASYAVFWVKVLEDLSASDRTIYIYYGNPTASTTSNGAATFLFFDDFSTKDTSKWSWTNMDVSGGWARPTADGATLTSTSSPITPGLNFRLRWVAKVSYTSGYSTFAADCRLYYSSSNYITVRDYYDYSGGTTSSRWFKVVSGATTTLSSSFGPAPYWDPITYEERRFGTSYTVIGEKSGSSGTVTATIGDSVFANNNLKIVLYINAPSSSAGFDYIFLGKYTSPEPSHMSWGPEEIAS